MINIFCIASHDAANNDYTKKEVDKLENEDCESVKDLAVSFTL